MDNIENIEKLKKIFSMVDSALLEDRLNICEYDGFFKEPIQEEKEVPLENSTMPLVNKNSNFSFKGTFKKIFAFLKNK